MINHKRKIKLIATTETRNSIGEMVKTESVREVFGEISSVTASEWFSAGQSKINSRFRVDVYEIDYKGETICEFDGVRYGIYRTYAIGSTNRASRTSSNRNSNKIELYLEEKVGITNEP